MTEEPIVTFTIALNDPELGPEEQEEIVQNLFDQLSELNEVRVERPENPTPTAGARPGIETLIGVLIAEVSWENIKSFLGFVGDRMSDKPIKVKVKVKGEEKEVEIEASSRREILEAEAIAQKILESMQEN